MATSIEFKEYVLDLLAPHVAVTARNMFGGVGVYAEGVMFALMTSDDVLYFKADEETRLMFAEAGMPQFMNMPYFQLPVEVMESSEGMKQWVAQAVAVAQRMAKKKKK